LFSGDESNTEQRLSQLAGFDQIRRRGDVIFDVAELVWTQTEDAAPQPGA